MLGHVTGSWLNDWPVGMPGFPCYWSEAGSRQVVRDAGCSSASLATLRKPQNLALGTKVLTFDREFEIRDADVIWRNFNNDESLDNV